jgi:aspartate aminotransferase
MPHPARSGYNPRALRHSNRTELLGFSDIVKIRNRVLDMQSRGERVLRLEGGEPYMPTPAFIKDAMKEALDANQTRYAPSSGIPQLLDAIRAKLAARNGVEGDIIVTSGGAHGLFCAFQATVNPGDDVMLFAPWWTPIRDQVHYCGGELVRVPWSETRGVDELGETLRAHRTEKTRVIYVNTPSNPTGDVLSRTQLESIARFAVEHDLIVISDEAYEDLVYDGEHVSLASLPGMRERTISVYTLSKSFAMTGWRVGYLVAGNVWMDALKKLVLNSINGVSTPSQFAAAAAVANGRGFIDSIVPEYRERRDRLVRGLTDAGFRCVPPKGAFYLFADARERLGANSWEAMETLLARTSIAAVPGVVFGPEGEGFLRMSFSTSMDVIDQAVEALKAL